MFMRVYVQECQRTNLGERPFLAVEMSHLLDYALGYLISRLCFGFKIRIVPTLFDD